MTVSSADRELNAVKAAGGAFVSVTDVGVVEHPVVSATGLSTATRVANPIANTINVFFMFSFFTTELVGAPQRSAEC